MAGYVLEQYERAGNHVAAAEGWTVVAATILHLVERDSVRKQHYEPSLNLSRTALYLNLERLEQEILTRAHFIETRYLTGERDDIRAARTTLTLGWLATKYFIDKPDDQIADNRIPDIVIRELKWLKFLSEADWPYVLVISLYLERFRGSSAGEQLIRTWVRGVVMANLRKESFGIPSPYWLQERALEFLHGRLPPYEVERFAGQSYTIHSALDMLVRRLLRQAVRTFWPSASRLTFLRLLNPATPLSGFYGADMMGICA